MAAIKIQFDVTVPNLAEVAAHITNSTSVVSDHLKTCKWILEKPLRDAVARTVPIKSGALRLSLTSPYTHPGAIPWHIIAAAGSSFTAEAGTGLIHAESADEITTPYMSKGSGPASPIQDRGKPKGRKAYYWRPRMDLAESAGMSRGARWTFSGKPKPEWYALKARFFVATDGSEKGWAFTRNRKPRMFHSNSLFAFTGHPSKTRGPFALLQRKPRNMIPEYSMYLDIPANLYLLSGDLERDVTTSIRRLLEKY